MSQPAPEPTTGRLDVEVVVPVFNEERVLADSVARLHNFLSAELPYSWRIVVADNASTDATAEVARALAPRGPRRQLHPPLRPVDWVKDPDSRVDIVATALADLRAGAAARS